MGLAFFLAEAEQSRLRERATTTEGRAPAGTGDTDVGPVLPRLALTFRLIGPDGEFVGWDTLLDAVRECGFGFPDRLPAWLRDLRGTGLEVIPTPLLCEAVAAFEAASLDAAAQGAAGGSFDEAVTAADVRLVGQVADGADGGVVLPPTPDAPPLPPRPAPEMKIEHRGRGKYQVTVDGKPLADADDRTGADLLFDSKAEAEAARDAFLAQLGA